MTQNLETVKVEEEFKLVPMDLDGSCGLLTEINWEELSDEESLNEKIAYYILNTCQNWSELDETNYSELVKEKTSIFDESELALSWTIYNLYKIAKIDGNFAFFLLN